MKLRCAHRFAAMLAAFAVAPASRGVLESAAIADPPPAVRPGDIKPFFDAVKSDDVKAAGALLDQDPALAGARRGENDATAMHLAPSVEMAQLLLNHGADINAADAHSDRPLRWAASRLFDDKAKSMALIQEDAMNHPGQHGLHPSGRDDFVQVIALLNAATTQPAP